MMSLGVIDESIAPSNANTQIQLFNTFLQYYYYYFNVKIKHFIVKQM